MNRTNWRQWEGVIAAPASYWRLSDAEHAEQCNGCGAASAVFDVVPDTLYGLSGRPA